MDFGKLFNVDRVRFEMPEEDPRSVLPGRRAGVPRVYVGAPIWSCPKWVGTIFPRGTAAKDYLRAYAAQIGVTELNPSFYQIPSREQIAKWREAVPADFRFLPKLFQGISHEENFAQARDAMRMFWENIATFGENLGICFLQLPPHVGLNSLGSLQRLLDLVPEPGKLAIEFRHPSWFSAGKLRPEIFAVLRARRISTVITDVAGRRDVLHSSLPTRKVMVRFNGNELHPSDFTRLEAWTKRLESWIAQGIEEVYFIVHQPDQNGVPELIQPLIADLNTRAGLSIRTWIPVAKEAPFDQMSLF